jgi:hypothetical protein
VVTVRQAGTAMSRMAVAGARLIVVVQATTRWSVPPVERGKGARTLAARPGTGCGTVGEGPAKGTIC